MRERRRVIMTLCGLAVMIAGTSILLLGCSVKHGTPSSPFPELMLSGPELWVIDGTAYDILKTGVIIFKDRPVMFFVQVSFDDPGEHQEHIAKSIARYAIQHGYRERARNVKNRGKPVELSTDMGVSMVKLGKGTFIKQSMGYNFQFSEQDLNQ